MRTERYWTGWAILTGLAMAILIAIPGRRAAPSGPVAGTVAIHGRPLAGGVIFFSPVGPQGGEGAVARIDEDGHFACDPRWRRDWAARTRYRIDILPDPQDLAPDPPPDDPADIPEAGDGGDPDRARDGGRGPIRRIARASLRSQVRPSSRRAVESGWRRRPGDVRMTEWVRLGSEPAHIDIDLRH